VASNNGKRQKRVVGFLGVGLDNQDGHQRLTQSEHFLLIGGSAETHQHMQDTAIRFAEKLRTKGKRLEDTSPQETLELLIEAQQS
jgi:hypothetical protein